MLRCELAKLRYARSTWIIGIGVVVTTVLGSLFMGFAKSMIDLLIRLNDVIPNATDAQSMSPQTLAQLEIDRPGIQLVVTDIFGLPGGQFSPLCLGAVLLGILAVTSEYRHGGIVLAALAEPGRTRFLAAKAGALTVVLTGLALLLCLLTTAVLLVAVLGQGARVEVAASDVLAMMLRSLVAAVGFGLAGIGLGFLVRAQTPALLLAFGVMLAESVLRPLARLVTDGFTPADLLPYGLAQDAAGVTDAMPLVPGLTGISPAVAVLTVAAWAAVLIAAGALALCRRDISLD